eukprot:SAG31_NODE_5599_length_2429_cov_36.011588_1_plen_253_part_00
MNNAGEVVNRFLGVERLQLLASTPKLAQTPGVPLLLSAQRAAATRGTAGGTDSFTDSASSSSAAAAAAERSAGIAVSARTAVDGGGAPAEAPKTGLRGGSGGGTSGSSRVSASKDHASKQKRRELAGGAQMFIHSSGSASASAGTVEVPKLALQQLVGRIGQVEGMLADQAKVLQEVLRRLPPVGTSQAATAGGDDGAPRSMATIGGGFGHVVGPSRVQFASAEVRPREHHDELGGVGSTVGGASILALPPR